MVLFHVDIQTNLKVSSFQKATKTIIGELIKNLNLLRFKSTKIHRELKTRLDQDKTYFRIILKS
jgi:hypothetical protein